MSQFDKELVRDEIGHGCFALDAAGHIIAFHDSIRDALIARGQLWCKDGVWHVADVNLEKDAPWLACCDFCSARPVVWDIPCDTFSVADGHTSLKGWAACETCGQLVVEGNRRALMRRIIKIFKLWGPTLAVQEEMQAGFWRHYRPAEITRIPARPFGH